LDSFAINEERHLSKTQISVHKPSSEWVINILAPTISLTVIACFTVA